MTIFMCRPHTYLTYRLVTYEIPLPSSPLCPSAASSSRHYIDSNRHRRRAAARLVPVATHAPRNKYRLQNGPTRKIQHTGRPVITGGGEAGWRRSGRSVPHPTDRAVTAARNRRHGPAVMIRRVPRRVTAVTVASRTSQPRRIASR